MKFAFASRIRDQLWAPCVQTKSRIKNYTRVSCTSHINFTSLGLRRGMGQFVESVEAVRVFSCFAQASHILLFGSHINCEAGRTLFKSSCRGAVSYKTHGKTIVS